MVNIDALNTAVSKGIEIHAIIDEHGTPELQAILRLFLFQLGLELAGHETEQQRERDGG